MKINGLTYKEYIVLKKHSELVDMIVGDENNPPLLTRNEKKYSRPQIIWAINKINKDKEIPFDFSEKEAEDLINKLEGYKWYNFHNYDYLRFDIRKPSFSVFIIAFIFSAIGVAYVLSIFAMRLIDLYEWI